MDAKIAPDTAAPKIKDLVLILEKSIARGVDRKSARSENLSNVACSTSPTNNGEAKFRINLH